MVQKYAGNRPTGNIKQERAKGIIARGTREEMIVPLGNKGKEKVTRKMEQKKLIFDYMK